MSLVEFRVKNRIPDLIKVINQSFEPDHKRRILTPIASEAGTKMLAAIRKEAPVGKIEPSYQVGNRTISHGRPSTRLHGKPLDESWMNPAITQRSNGVAFTLGTDTQQARILLAGSPSHRIPKTGEKLMSWWWFREGKSGIASYIKEHPGFTAINFVERAYNKSGKRIMSDAIKKGQKMIIDPVSDFFRR